MTTSYIGQPQSRVDGRAKVTGAAKYAAEHSVPHLLHGVVVASTIAKGAIEKIDASDALALEGVVYVFTHENRPKTARLDLKYKDMIAPPGSPFRPLHDEKILHNDQPIALVVAESLELARYAAALVRVHYQKEPHKTSLAANLAEAHEPRKRPLVPKPESPRGDVKTALAQADVRHEAEYVQPFEHHNPMELFASTVIHEADGSLTIYDKTQGAHNSKLYVANVFGLSRNKVRVVSPFVGGAFGAALRPQPQLFLAVMASLALKRSVRVEVSRREMFSGPHRPYTIQKLALGASADGTLQAVKHEAFTDTSTFEDFSENIVNWSGMLYQCENVAFDHQLVQLDLPTSGDMRAPGAPTGLWALESAMDELACKLEIDPLELRLRNYAEREQNLDKPFSSKELRACYHQAAEAFGWARRTPAPRSTRAGHELIGWGMATGVWDALYVPTAAKALLTADGRLTVSSGTADIGTGTYTIMTQIAAETLGLPLESVTFALGDTTLPARAGRRRLDDGGVLRLGGQGGLRGGAEAALRPGPEAAGLAILRSEPGRRDLRRRIDRLEGRPDPAARDHRGDAPERDRRDRGIDHVAAHLRGAEPEAEKIRAQLPFGGLRRGAGGRRPRHDPRHPRGERHRRGTHPQSQDRTEPDPRRGRLGHRNGAGRGDGDRPAVRPLHERQPRRIPCPGQRRRAGHRCDLRRGAR